jgi:hypothetical protein
MYDLFNDADTIISEYLEKDIEQSDYILIWDNLLANMWRDWGFPTNTPVES